MVKLPAAHWIAAHVSAALAEDIGAQDYTAQLIAPDCVMSGQVIAREAAVICGQAWFDECFRQVDAHLRIEWLVDEGAEIAANTPLCRFHGTARALLTAERSALNFLQCLSGTATTTREYVRRVAGFRAKIMDTRKTLPGLRAAQKYAVAVGGGHNQRMGLYDGILIKENHIAAAGSIAAALAHAKTIAPEQVSIQIEVENLTQLDDALNAGARLILLDNFDVPLLSEAVRRTAGRAQLEASGNVSLETLAEIAATGVDRISIGALTKHMRAIDLSMRFDAP